jgi:hypothetical protein
MRGFARAAGRRLANFVRPPMIGFRLRYNDEEPVLGAAEDSSVLHATVSVTGQLGPGTAQIGEESEPHFHIHLGGLTGREGARPDEHLNWYDRWEASPGDRIVIEIIDTDIAPEPSERKEAGSKSPSSDERAFYERT